MNDLQKLFLSELKSIYDAEHQLVEGLGEMQKSTKTEEVKDALEEHLGETKAQVKRLENVFHELGENPSRRTCHAIRGMIRESQGVLRQAACTPAVILSARKVEHYEISSYGTLCTWAKELDCGSVRREAGGRKVQRVGSEPSLHARRRAQAAVYF